VASPGPGHPPAQCPPHRGAAKDGQRGVAHAAREAGEDRVRSQRGQGGEPKAGSQGESEDPDGRVSKWVCN